MWILKLSENGRMRHTGSAARAEAVDGQYRNGTTSPRHRSGVRASVKGPPGARTAYRGDGRASIPDDRARRQVDHDRDHEVPARRRC